VSFSSFFRSILEPGTFLTAGLLIACGVDDRKVNEGAGGVTSVAGSSASSGTSAGNDQGGTSAGGAMPDSSGAGGEAGEAGAGGTAGATTPACVNGSLRCDDSSTPSKCVGGDWIPQDPCPASRPACSNGVCAAARLSGGIVTVSDGVLSTSTVRLVQHGFEYTQTTCGTVGSQKVCVTGGIRP
jgi:hypothetical protein